MRNALSRTMSFLMSTVDSQLTSDRYLISGIKRRIKPYGTVHHYINNSMFILRQLSNRILSRCKLRKLNSERSNRWPKLSVQKLPWSYWYNLWKTLMKSILHYYLQEFHQMNERVEIITLLLRFHNGYVKDETDMKIIY